ncbi:MAG: hypothetical protein K8S22_08370 [Betaproteobacteria bacterium]|nr:hypothetical protein [Betaproteobacteria bacterium]
MKFLPLLAFMVVLATDVKADVSACPPQTAQFVEESIERIDSWDEFVIFYRKFKACDSSALSYAFTQSIVTLAAAPHGMSSLWSVSLKAIWLRKVVVKHLESEAIDSELAKQVIANAQKDCPKQAKQFCDSVRRRLAKSD